MKRTTATGSAGGMHVDRVPGVSSGSRGIAEDRNNWQEEICSVIEGLGVALDGMDWMQLEKAIIARSHIPAQIIDMGVELTPVGWASAKSKAAPGNPDYLPVVPLWDADHDLAAAVYPLLVAALRAQKAKASNGAGGWVTDHAANIAAHVITGAGTAWDNLLAALAEDQLKETAAATAAGGWGYGKAAFTNWRCLNVNGTDYPIVGISTAGHTITISGDALAGAVTVISYPYRISGSTDARVFQDSGDALVAAGTQECIGGFRRRDRMQGHWHDTPNATSNSGSSTATDRLTTKSDGTGSDNTRTDNVGNALTDTVNGTPRTGTTTDPRGTIVYRYLWAGIYLA